MTYSNNDFAAIQRYIDEAHIQRAVYLSELTADFLFSAYVAVKEFVRLNIDGFFETKKLTTQKNVFLVE